MSAEKLITVKFQHDSQYYNAEINIGFKIKDIVVKKKSKPNIKLLFY